MSCHGRKLNDGSMLWVCKSPIFGFTSEEEWIRRELRLFKHKARSRTALETRLQQLKKQRELINKMKGDS